MSNQNVKDAIASGIIMRYSDGLLREGGETWVKLQNTNLQPGNLSSYNINSLPASFVYKNHTSSCKRASEDFKETDICNVSILKYT